MEKGLQAEYDALVRKAATRGFTSVHGCTPREHMARLLRAGPWLEADLRRLTEMVEGGVFAGSPEKAAEGVRICRRLAAELPNLPPPPKAPAPRSPPGPILRLSSRAIVPIFLAVAVVFAAFFIPRLGPGPVGGRGGIRFRGSARGGSPWRSVGEKASIRKLMDRWKSPPAETRFETVHMPDVQMPGDVSGAFEISLQTGVDHRFRNVKEPFSPPLNHHHRQFVYSWFDPSFRPRMIRSPLRNAVAESAPEGARIHRADVKIHLEAGTAVPVPVPAPDSVVVSFEPIPGVELRFVKDLSDGLRVWSDRSGTYRLRYVTATVSDYLLAPLPGVPFDGLELRPLSLPAELRREARIVLDRIGLPASGTYAERVRYLHAYFAGFSVAPLQPSEMVGSRYLTLALARKGTCGHRSLTFVVTANAAGVPARLVMNDIHAFPEVQLPDGSWRALELRILDGEKNYPLTTLASLSGASTAIGLLVFTIMAIALWAAAARRPAAVFVATGEAGSRARRRAERDVARGLSSHVMLRLVGATLDRLARARCIPDQDRAALRRAVREEGLLPPLSVAIVSLLDLEETARPGSPIDRYSLREAYWSARRVLEWLEKGPTS